MIRLLVSLLILPMFAGCSIIMSSATASLTDNLSLAILNQNDPETARDGIPTFLLILDAQIQGNPESDDLLMAGAKLYGTYAGNFAEDELRARRLAERALTYGKRGLCLRLEKLCEVIDAPFQTFSPVLTDTDEGDIDTVYGFAVAWASWIQVNSDDWNAIAVVPKLEAMMQWVLEQDENHDGGGAHLYLGVIKSQLPPALGGKPELAKAHFERAITISSNHNLMAKTLYAEHYARLMFERELHDKLLREVIAADPVTPELTLANILAQDQARKLLLSADEYF